MFRIIGLAVRRLFPGYFALVIATGIVSIGASLLDMPVVAWGRAFRSPVSPTGYRRIAHSAG